MEFTSYLWHMRCGCGSCKDYLLIQYVSDFQNTTDNIPSLLFKLLWLQDRRDTENTSADRLNPLTSTRSLVSHIGVQLMLGCISATSQTSTVSETRTCYPQSIHNRLLVRRLYVDSYSFLLPLSISTNTWSSLCQYDKVTIVPLYHPMVCGCVLGFDRLHESQQSSFANLCFFKVRSGISNYLRQLEQTQE